jgi:peptide-methionine (S)-S-oxide reductase
MLPIMLDLRDRKVLVVGGGRIATRKAHALVHEGALVTVACSEGDTGYNEVVRLQYDPAIISLPDVLTIFCGIHDPTSLNRQGNDQGTQYRSGVYYSALSDEAVIVQTLTQLQANYGQPIVTEVEALQHYWPAEDYHQDYFLNNPNQGYCAFVVAPKVVKLEQHFSQWLKA